MFSHLSSLAGVLVRETATREYLERHGVSHNVHLVADPAFLMDPIPVTADRLGFTIPPGAIGLNLSPLLAKYFVKTDRPVWDMTDGDLTPWIDFSAEVVRTVISSTGRTVVLIPHVSSPVHSCDDFWFLDAVKRKVANEGRRDVLCVSTLLSAAELKSVIASCAVFCGARTHATIAALSSGVPTLSFGYSMKARGLNQDIFDHLDYCLDARALSMSLIRDSVVALLAHEREIRRALECRIPVIQERAWSAGPILKGILENRSV
jgi:polysaccharide pyruvyl transferase WcaK-like protein